MDLLNGTAKTIYSDMCKVWMSIGESVNAGLVDTLFDDTYVKNIADNFDSTEVSNTDTMKVTNDNKDDISKTDKTELVTDGIYQISRNPAFLGFDLVYIGILLMFFNPWLLIASVFAMLMFHLQIVNVEEDFLLETFGQEYLAYKKKVNRYIGRK